MAHVKMDTQEQGNVHVTPASMGLHVSCVCQDDMAFLANVCSNSISESISENNLFPFLLLKVKRNVFMHLSLLFPSTTDSLSAAGAVLTLSKNHFQV